MISIDDMRESFRAVVRLNEPLAVHTTFGVGGPTDFLIEPSTKRDFVAAVQYFRDQQIPFFLLGKGSNVLAADSGYRGAIIEIDQALGHIRIREDGTADIGAGVSLGTLIDFCIQHSFAGLETLAGLGGTVGGRLARGGELFGGLLQRFLVEVEVLHGREIDRVTYDAKNFSRNETGPDRDIILEARMRFPWGNKEALLRRRRESLLLWNASDTLNLSKGGRAFKDPPQANAARLVVQSGMVNIRQGGASIDGRNPNFIGTSFGATAGDVLELLRKVQRSVQEHFNVLLEHDAELIGFAAESLREVA